MGQIGQKRILAADPALPPPMPGRRAPLDGWRWIVKDLQDRAIAALLLLFLAPLMLLLAGLVRATSPGPVLFRQPRYGHGGRIFDIIKFRTMTQAASRDSEHRLTLAVRDDRRITPVGRFLRRTSMDELPQLLNVLRGEMWLIGPRPHSPHATVAGVPYAEAVDDYPRRYRVKPGMTGCAQVNGWRGPTETVEQIANRVAFDLFYIENWSVLLDARILLRTVSCVLADDAAF